MTGPLQAIQALPVLSWRGLEWPHYADCNFRYAHRQAPHTYYESQGSHHQLVGAEPIGVSVTLLFFNSLEEGAFPGSYKQWEAALNDGSRGPLQHPLLPPLDFVVQNYEVGLSASSTSGVTVSANWAKDLLHPDDQLDTEALNIDIKAAAAAADAVLQERKLFYPDGSDIASTVDIVTLVESYRFLADTELFGAIRRGKELIEDMHRRVLALSEHVLSTVVDNLALVWSFLEELAEKVGLSRPTQSRRVNVATTIAKFAEESGNSYADIIELNPDLLLVPKIAAGTPVAYYA